jgi:hypothetical protein
MTPTTTPLSLKEHLRNQTERGHRLLVNDLQALAAEKHNVGPGGSARPAIHIVAECAAVNQMIAGYLRTGTRAPRPTPEEREAHLSAFDTTDKALNYLRDATEELLGAIAMLDESTLGEMSDQPLGRPMTRFAVAELPAFHMMYHDGQLNYIHTLHGDTEMHWG